MAQNYEKEPIATKKRVKNTVLCQILKAICLLQIKKTGCQSWNWYPAILNANSKIAYSLSTVLSFKNGLSQRRISILSISFY